MLTIGLSVVLSAIGTTDDCAVRAVVMPQSSSSSDFSPCSQPLSVIVGSPEPPQPRRGQGSSTNCPCQLCWVYLQGTLELSCTIVVLFLFFLQRQQLPGIDILDSDNRCFDHNSATFPHRASVAPWAFTVLLCKRVKIFRDGQVNKVLQTVGVYNNILTTVPLFCSSYIFITLWTKYFIFVCN